MLSFKELLSRLDEEELANLLGIRPVRILSTLDPSLTRPSSLRSLISGLYSPHALLQNQDKRYHLLKFLKPRELEELSRYINPAKSLSYDDIRNIRITRKSKREAALYHFFGLSLLPEVVDRSELQTKLVEPGYRLFDHQRQTVTRLKETLRDDPTQAVLHLPTGAGKTRTAMSFICDELRAYPKTLVIWVAAAEELCEQAAAEFEKAWLHLGDRDISVVRYWGNSNPDLNDESDGIIICGLKKLYSSISANSQPWERLADRCSLVVVDEAHQAIAETYQSAIKIIAKRNDKTKLLGLTATPGRTYSDIDEDEKLSDFFGRKKVSMTVKGYDSPFDYLVEAGYLSSTRFLRLAYEGIGSELSNSEAIELADAAEVPDRVLSALGHDDQRNIKILTTIEALARRHSRIIVFAPTVENASDLSVVLRARGLEANAITSKTDKNERERLINRYREEGDECRILVNFGVLVAGFDAPETSAAVICRPTKSLVLYSQMAGRAMRGPKAGGNSRAEIVTVVDTDLPGFRNLSEAFMNWEDIWDG